MSPSRPIAARVFADMLAVLLMLGLGACGVDASPGGASTPVVPVARAESVPAGAGGHTSERPERRNDPRRVVAIGDVHGDLAAGLAALRSAALIDQQAHWSGGQTVMVQVGDLLDRGDGEAELMDLFERLREEARASGGEVHLLLGNHELMNAAGDLTYVTRGGFAQFANTPPHPSHEADVLRAPQLAHGRLRAFLPGGPFAVRLATYGLTYRSADAIFVHGGILPQHLRELERMESESQAWLRDERRIPTDVALHPDSPLWTRRYSISPGARACAEVARTLDAEGLSRMVVAHTVQDDGITSYCSGRVIAIDCGLSSYYGGPVQVLELRAGVVRVLSARGAPRTLPAVDAR
ncbi:MAG: metallophosphoesterase [Sandaracinaceae bacterium]|nr:metallophosphoesterase [Sandaracinaceae bacterium]